MKEADAEIVLQRAREKFPLAGPRVISDNGPQFIAKDFKEFIRLWRTSHVLTSPHYPQSAAKDNLKGEDVDWTRGTVSFIPTLNTKFILKMYFGI